MCCGNKRTANIPAASKSSPSKNGGVAGLVVGSEGMTLLEYQLPKAGSIIYIGAVTHQPYAFSSTRKRGYVDSRDAPGLLARMEDRRHPFIQVSETPVENNVPTQPFAEPTPAPQAQAVLETKEIEITETVPQAEPMPAVQVGKGEAAVPSYMNRKPRKAKS